MFKKQRSEQEIVERVKYVMPQEMLNWDPNEALGPQNLGDHRSALMKELPVAACFPTNSERVAEAPHG